jgi:hypothetical protein
LSSAVRLAPTRRVPRPDWCAHSRIILSLPAWRRPGCALPSRRWSAAAADYGRPTRLDSLHLRCPRVSLLPTCQPANPPACQPPLPRPHTPFPPSPQQRPTRYLPMYTAVRPFRQPRMRSFYHPILPSARPHTPDGMAARRSPCVPDKLVTIQPTFLDPRPSTKPNALPGQPKQHAAAVTSLLNTYCNTAITYQVQSRAAQ